MNPKRLPDSLTRRAAVDLDLFERRACDVLRAPGCPVSLDDYDAHRLRSCSVASLSVEGAARLRLEPGRSRRPDAATRSQAQAAEQQVARMQAGLVAVHEVAELLGRWVVGFRAQLLVVADRLADRFTAQQIDNGRRELFATLDGLVQLRDEWHARADDIDARAAVPT